MENGCGRIHATEDWGTDNCWVGGHLLGSSEEGDLVLGRVDENGFEKLGEIHVLEGITWNPLAIAGDRVLLRNGEQAACVEIPLASSDP